MSEGKSKEKNQTEEDGIRIGNRTIKQKDITSHIEKGANIYNNDDD